MTKITKNSQGPLVELTRNHFSLEIRFTSIYGPRRQRMVEYLAFQAFMNVFIQKIVSHYYKTIYKWHFTSIFRQNKLPVQTQKGSV